MVDVRNPVSLLIFVLAGGIVAILLNMVFGVVSSTAESFLVGSGLIAILLLHALILMYLLKVIPKNISTVGRFFGLLFAVVLLSNIINLLLPGFEILLPTNQSVTTLGDWGVAAIQFGVIVGLTDVILRRFKL